MFQHKAAGVTLATIVICAAICPTAGSQEYKTGDEVVALRDCELKVGRHPVGTVRKGEKLAIEQIQGKWLWVRHGDARGWINSQSVLGADLMAWYQRLPNMASETEEDSGRTRAKIGGVMFEIVTAGPGVVTLENVRIALSLGMTLEDVTIPYMQWTTIHNDGKLDFGTSTLHIESGVRFPGNGVTKFVGARLTLEGVEGATSISIPDGLLYDTVNIQLRESANGRRALCLRFPGSRVAPPPPPGRSYGTVEPNDYVLILTRTRQVFVNGQERRLGAVQERESVPIPLNREGAEAHRKRGDDWLARGEYDQAIGSYTEAIRLSPQHAEAHLGRGVAFGEKGDYVRATSDFSEAIELKPDFAVAYRNRGLVWQRRGWLDLAIADYNKAISLNPQDAEAYTYRGNARYGIREANDAIADWSEAIRLNPQDARAYHNRGVAWHEEDELDRAIADFDQALRLNPNYAQAYLNRGLAKQKKGDHAGADEDFARAKRLGLTR